MTKKEKEKLAEHMTPIIQEALQWNIASNLNNFRERLNDHLIDNLPPEFEIAERLNDFNVEKVILLHRGFVFKNLKVDPDHIKSQKLELAMLAHSMYEQMIRSDDVDYEECRQYHEKLRRL